MPFALYYFISEEIRKEGELLMRLWNGNLCIVFIMLPFLPYQLHSSSSSATSQAILQSNTITEKTAGQYSKLFDRITPYPAKFIYTDPTTQQKRIQQGLTNRQTKHLLPKVQHQMAGHANLSILRPSGANKDNFYKNYPSGSTLFPSYAGDLATKFDAIINELKANHQLIKFFRKIHINVLNELYNYLMKIYTNFNLRHVGSKQTSSGLVIDVPTYLKDEDSYATNKKTLIVNHLVNVIEAQFNSSIQSYVPAVPHLLATHVGKTCIQSDFSIDLTHFILKQEDKMLEHLQSSYLDFFAKYLDFFREYTSYLAKKDTTTGFNHFTQLAKNIHAFINQNGSDKALEQMDPPMFFYDYDTMRAIRIIPHLASELPAQSKSIGWPATIVNAAEKLLMVDNHPIAYFKNNLGKVIQNKDEATHLYMVIGSGANLYEQELLSQPSWLNTEEGVLNILRACLGDFSAIIGMGVLDPCMETLLQKGLARALGQADTQESTQISQVCRQLIEKWKTGDTTIPQKKQASSGTTVSLPPTSSPSSLLSPTSSSLSPSTSDMQNSNSLTPSSGDLSPSSQDLSPSTSDLSPSSSSSSLLSPSASSISMPSGV